MDIEIREQRLPGVGHRYELVVDENRTLTVVVQDRGRRELGVLRRGADERDVVVSLSQQQAVALAALLAGARFSIQPAGGEDVIDDDEVTIETVTLGPSSPLVGRPVTDIGAATEGDVAVLAVVRDGTPELVGQQEGRRCQPGDRVVIAARRDRLEGLVRQLSG